MFNMSKLQREPGTRPDSLGNLRPKTQQTSRESRSGKAGNGLEIVV